MEGGRCNVVYYDGIAGRDFVVDHANIAGLEAICSAHLRGGQKHPQRSPQELTANIRALSAYFGKSWSSLADVIQFAVLISLDSPYLHHKGGVPRKDLGTRSIQLRRCAHCRSHCST